MAERLWPWLPTSSTRRPDRSRYSQIVSGLAAPRLLSGHVDGGKRSSKKRHRKLVRRSVVVECLVTAGYRSGSSGLVMFRALLMDPILAARADTRGCYSVLCEQDRLKDVLLRAKQTANTGDV